MYRVMLVEKDRLMLSKLSAVIERTPGFTMAVRYQSKQDALGQGRMFDPNLILLDIDNENAIPLIESFHQSYPCVTGISAPFSSVYSCQAMSM